MIWALAKEQLRAQRRYVTWTGAVIAFTVGIAVYGVLFTVATASAVRNVDAMLGGDREWTATTVLTDEANAEPGGAWITLDQFESAMTEGAATGADPFALAQISALLPPTEPASFGWGWTPVVGVGGSVDWDAILVDGVAPHAGQIVLSAEYARDMGLQIGDSVQLLVSQYSETADAPPVEIGAPMEVSGIAHSGAGLGPLRITVPDGYVGMADAAALEAASLDEFYGSVPDLDPQPPMLTAEVTWNGSMPLFDLGAQASYGALGGFGSTGGERTVLTIALVGVAALIIGIFAMAFAVGRAQAQARSKWVATARALGVTKGRIAGATLLESTVIGVLAGLAGLVFGTLITSVHSVVVRLAQPSSVFDSPVSFDWRVSVGAVVLGLVLALIVGAIPAFWSTRVTPVTALKPVSELTEAEVSRRVAVQPILIAWVVATVVAAVCALTGAPGLVFVVLVAALVVSTVLGVVLMQESLRWWVPRAGRRLSRSAKRYAMVAGDIIVARPRQIAIPGFITALGVGALIAVCVTILGSSAPYVLSPDYYGSSLYDEGAVLWIAWPTIGVFAIATILAVAISASAGTLTAREAATREALGVTRRDGQLGAALAYGVGQVGGIVVGCVAGGIAGAWLIQTTVESEVGLVAPWLWSMGWVLLFVVGIGAVMVAAGAAITGALTPTAAPIARFETAA